MTADLIEPFAKKPNSMIKIQNAPNRLKPVIRRGDHKLAYMIIKEASEHETFGYSKLHCEALLEEGEPTRVLPVSVLKKNMMDGITPLHVACINPNVTPLKKILSVNPAYDFPDAEGYKPVHYAAACEEDGPLKYLISKRVVNINAGKQSALSLENRNDKASDSAHGGMHVQEGAQREIAAGGGETTGGRDGQGERGREAERCG